jgi:hypothetical protein
MLEDLAVVSLSRTKQHTPLRCTPARRRASGLSWGLLPPSRCAVASLGTPSAQALRASGAQSGGVRSGRAAAWAVQWPALTG